MSLYQFAIKRLFLPHPLTPSPRRGNSCFVGAKPLQQTPLTKLFLSLIDYKLILKFIKIVVVLCLISSNVSIIYAAEQSKAIINISFNVKKDDKPALELSKSVKDVGNQSQKSLTNINLEVKKNNKPAIKPSQPIKNIDNKLSPKVSNNVNLEVKKNDKPAIELSKSVKDIGNQSQKSLTNINLEVKKNDKPAIKLSQPVKNVDNKLSPFDPDTIQQTFQIQKKMDIEDITALWESTVEKNNVIKFALKKLITPTEQRKKNSSIMARSISTLISGAAILPNVLGADSLTSTATLAGGNLVNRAIGSKTMPKHMPLTDTELIQLAKLIENLQDRIIKNYYDYKSAIESLRICRQNLILENKNYADALKSNNEISILSWSALYDKELYNEMQLKQKVKLYRLELERLADTKVVDNLNLTRLIAFNNTNKEDSKEKSNAKNK